MYSLYLAGTRMPVPPEKIEIATKGKNETVTLISGEEVNLIKKPGLSECSFELLLPAHPYHFAFYEAGVFQTPDYYTELFEFLMTSESYFCLDLYRESPDGAEQLRHINMPVTLEEYSVAENAEDGQDWVVKLKLKYYRAYGTKVLVPDASGSGYTVARADTKEAVRVVVTKKDDTLQSICLREFQSDAKEYLDKVYRLNKATFDQYNKGDVSYIVENPEEWETDAMTLKSNIAALVDKAFLGGHRDGLAESDPGLHWSQPYLVSLQDKDAISNWRVWAYGDEGAASWLDLESGLVTQAYMMALVDKITGGTCYKYVDRICDHWGRNHLDSLCDKGMIKNPEKWKNFQAPVENSNALSLVNQALAATIDKYRVYPGMRLLLWEK